jgi:hypothetical protein
LAQRTCQRRHSCNAKTIDRRQRAAISDQRSAISHQRSAISDQRSEISHQPAAVNQQPAPCAFRLVDGRRLPQLE